MKKILLLMLVSFLICSAYGAVGDSWNLNDDWSTTMNDPNFPWIYHQVVGTSFTVFEAWGGPDFPLGEMGWRLPGKSAHLGMSKLVHNSSEDTSHPLYSYLAGEICGHTNENWGATWVVPATEGDGGKYRITGSIHEVRSGMGSVIATLKAAGVQLFSYEMQEGQVPGSGKNVDYPYTFVHEVLLDASEPNNIVDLTMSMIGNGDFGCIGDFNIERISNIDAVLTLNVIPAYVNMIDPAAGEYTLTMGQTYNLSAETYINCANNGEVLVFDSWTGDVADPYSATTTILMNSNKTVTANYVDGRQCGDACHPYPQYDFSQDCIVDLTDFSMLAAEWLACSQPVCD